MEGWEAGEEEEGWGYRISCRDCEMLHLSLLRASSVKRSSRHVP